MFDEQPEVSAEVMRLLKKVIKKHMAPLKVVRVHAEGKDSGWEGGPTIRVTTEYLGKAGDVDPKKYVELWPILRPKLEKLGETRWPAFTFVLAKEAKNAA